MGNLFLGFPVARAKIADMISTSAPPSLHHAQHENGGTDEIDVTGLTGAGGGGGGIGSFYNYSSSFDDYNTVNADNSGSGTVSLSAYSLSIKTGTTAGSRGGFKKGLYAPLLMASWNKNRVLIISPSFECLTSAGGQYTIRNGDLGVSKHIGFKIIDGVLYGTVGNDTAENTTALLTIDTIAYTYRPVLKCVFTAGVKCEFYVDEILKGTITTGLPTGDADGLFMFYARAENTTYAEQKELYIGGFNIQIAQ